MIDNLGRSVPLRINFKIKFLPPNGGEWSRMTGWWSVSITISERFHLQSCGKRERSPRIGAWTNFHPLRNESVFFRNKPRMPFGSSASITIKFPWNWITNFPLKFLLPSLLIRLNRRSEENRKCISRIEIIVEFLPLPDNYDPFRFFLEIDRFNLSLFHLSLHFLTPMMHSTSRIHISNSIGFCPASPSNWIEQRLLERIYTWYVYSVEFYSCCFLKTVIAPERDVPLRTTKGWKSTKKRRCGCGSIKRKIRRFVVASTHKFQIGKDEYIEMTNEADIEIT